MSLPDGFTEHYATALASAASASDETPLTLDLVTQWNRELLQPFYPRIAGQLRSERRTLDFPHRPIGRREWQRVTTEATRVNDMLGELVDSYRSFEDALGGIRQLKSAEEAAGPVAWPAAVTVRSQPFQSGNLFVAWMVLVVAASRAGWAVDRGEWSGKLGRARLYWAVRRDRPATIKPFADLLAPSLQPRTQA